MRLLTKFALVSLTLAVAPRLTDEVWVRDTASAMWAAVLYGLLFVFIGWLIKLLVGVLSIVPGILTLGLFFFLVPTLVNMVLLKFTAGLMDSFEIRTWSAAFLLSLALGVINWLFERKGDDN